MDGDRSGSGSSKQRKENWGREKAELAFRFIALPCVLLKGVVLFLSLINFGGNGSISNNTLRSFKPLSPTFNSSTVRNSVLARNSISQVPSSTGAVSAKEKRSFPGKPEADVVVIGSGIGGLCCTGLLARYQQDVLVLESHDLPGGAAHSFDIKGFNLLWPILCSLVFSPKALRLILLSVLDALGETIPCASYDSWMVYLPEGPWRSMQVQMLFENEKNFLMPFFHCLQLQWLCLHFPSEGIVGVLSTAAARYAPSLLKSFVQMGPQGALGATKLLRPFSEIIDSLELKDPFIRNWVDLLAFLLAGVKSNGILSAEMIYMFAEWYKPGCCLEYPLHGSGAIVDALVRGFKKFGGRISLGSHVEKIVVANGRATGVKLRSGQAVVSNASMWDTLNLLPKEVVPKSYLDRTKTTPQCESFMHLHLGFDAELLMIGIEEWMLTKCCFDICTYVLSPDLAPPGKHVLHAYLPGTEPFDLWKGFDRKSSAYKELKAERSEREPIM
ncbi:unnamed protein product [Prunus armeniaca]|uniref:Amine oxidase domain-containing protein n=1 Tax=Prunus armeniaca TaxID=36596 RepID=A0A6J5W9R2_PRUAR|nr:unnamed protein product [Prunus armeniaca]